MEKLLRRTILNRNQLVTKKRRESAKDLRKTWRDFNRTKNSQDNEVERLVKNERLARREDWVMGPLAPKRDVGMRSQTYGSVGNLLAQGPQLPARERRGPKGNGFDAVGREDRRLPEFSDGKFRGEWKGEGLHGNLVVGDRVVVVRGRMGVKGKIGEVLRIDQASAMIFVKGVNKVDMQVPRQALGSASGQKIFEQELPIPIADVCLVWALPDPVTGALKDTIIRHICGRDPYVQQKSGSNLPRHTRYAKDMTGTGRDTVIPWPKEDPDRYYTQSCDSTSDLVDTITYVPELDFGAPLPDGVIDELRGKHSRQRKDWDDLQFMQKKLLQDARRDWFTERSQKLSEPFWTKEFLARQKKAVEQRGMEQEQSAVI